MKRWTGLVGLALALGLGCGASETGEADTSSVGPADGLAMDASIAPEDVGGADDSAATEDIAPEPGVDTEPGADVAPTDDVAPTQDAAVTEDVGPPPVDDAEVTPGDGAAMADTTDAGSEADADSPEEVDVWEPPPCEASDEVCDGLDNDCDDQVDEGLVYTGPDGTSVPGWGLPCGKGACAGGVTICGDDGALVCSSDGNIGDADDDCDLEDDDCDGAADEGFISEQMTTCGSGACVAEGTMTCQDGVVTEDCTPADGNATEEVCNDVDDDCDEVIDEDMPLEICNDIDDDCDGEIDEASDVVVAEVCNGADDDCDGQVDEGMPDLDQDGVVDCVDDDLDGDTIDNDADNCPVDANTDQTDEDDDGIGDVCDLVGPGDACGGHAQQDVILVTTTEDEMVPDGDCSLREAIQAANDDVAVDGCKAGDGADVISLGTAGSSYGLALAGAWEDENQTGDLDIYGVVAIYGCGADETKVNGGQLDRVFQVHDGASLQLFDVTLSQGSVVGGDGQIPDGGVGAGFGGAIHNAGELLVHGCAFIDNEVIGGTGSDGAHAPGNGGGGGGGAGMGGAIYSSGTLTVEPGLGGCTFAGNVAMGGLGGKGKWHGGVTPYTGYGGGGGGPAGGVGGNNGDGFGGGFGGGGGGGGGKSCGSNCGSAGGPGGFGGGGGGGGGASSGGNSGTGGPGGFGAGSGGIGCCSAAAGGGGGAGLGGAIFNDDGEVTVGACTFSSNQTVGGTPGGNHFGGTAAEAGGSYGGAVFTLGGTTVIAADATFADNAAETDGQDDYQVDP